MKYYKWLLSVYEMSELYICLLICLFCNVAELRHMHCMSKSVYAVDSPVSDCL